MKIRIRYWDIYRRNESERQREKDHVTRFGPHWVVEQVKRPAGARDYSTDGSPYEPRKGYAGVWKGRTTPAGKAAPNRWPTQGRGPLPCGLGGMQIMMILRRWAIDIVNALRLSNDPHSYQRLRDLRRHIFEQTALQPRHAQAMDCPEFDQTDKLRWALGFSNDAVADLPTGPYDTYVAAANGMKIENITGTIEKRRAKYGKLPRERQKAGRKPIGPVAQTSARSGFRCYGGGLS